MNVSVIVPAYNEALSLPRTLEALTNQSHPADEIIVADNNSTDNTVKVAKTFSVKIINVEEQGLIPTRNAGFNCAKHEIIARIDADTLVDTGWIERIRTVFQDPQVTAVSGPTYFYDAPFQDFGREVHKFACHQINNLLSGHNILLGSNTALRKTTWDKIRDQVHTEKDIMEDLDLALHIAESGGKIVFDDELVVGNSLARAQNSYGDLKNYLKMWPRTYTLHEKRVDKIANVMAYALLLFRPPVELMMHLYDKEQDKIVINKILKERKRNHRGNP